MWTENFQMYKLDLEKVEEPEIKLPTLIGSWRKQGSSRKTSTSALLTMPKPLTLWITAKSLTGWAYQTSLSVSWENYVDQEATVRNGHRKIDWFKTGKGVQGCILLPCLFNLYAEYLIWNAGWNESQAGIQITGRSYQQPKLKRN